MIVGCEADGVTVPIPPREWLNRLLGKRHVKPRAQDSTIADSIAVRTLERRHGRSGALHAEGGVPAGLCPTAGVKYVVAQHNVLTGDIVLVCAAAVITTHHAAVGCGPLRPIDPVGIEGQLFRWVVAGRQLGNEGGNFPTVWVDDHDA